MTRLLVLEDDDGLRSSLRLVLEEAGYEVHEAAQAEDALDLVRTTEVDLMLVDLMLGGMDGFSFIQRVRPDTDAPIVVISARDGVQDVVAALEAGADDYVAKPFLVDELKARLKALLRRPTMASETPDATGDAAVLDSTRRLVLDRGAAMLTRSGTEIHLTHTEFRLLCVLTEHGGRVLSREVLLEHVWDQSFHGDDRLVDVHVRRLRKKIEEEPSSPTILVTVRGLGYRLDAR